MIFYFWKFRNDSKGQRYLSANVAGAVMTGDVFCQLDQHRSFWLLHCTRSRAHVFAEKDGKHALHVFILKKLIFSHTSHSSNMRMCLSKRTPSVSKKLF